MFYTQFLKLCREKGVSPSNVAEAIGFNRFSAAGWKRGSKPNALTIPAVYPPWHGRSAQGHK